ncbi:MAG: hypothetical protein ACLFSQ_05965 [Candidatus Zixiibacteriota bacterium]
MANTAIKDKIIKTVNELPDDASIEEAMEKIYLLHKIIKGIHQANNGEVSSHDDAKKRFEKWLG